MSDLRKELFFYLTHKNWDRRVFASQSHCLILQKSGASSHILFSLKNSTSSFLHPIATQDYLHGVITRKDNLINFEFDKNSFWLNPMTNHHEKIQPTSDSDLIALMDNLFFFMQESSQ